jgi:hypothetical protein
MKIKMLFVALAVLALASMSFAQSQATAIFELDEALTETCVGGPIIPDGTVGYIYWNSDLDNVAEETDPLVVVGDGLNEANWNSYALNGNDYLGIPGGWYSDPAFIFNLPNLVNSTQVFLVIESNLARWTSHVITITSGAGTYLLTQDDFDCAVTTVPCDEPTFIHIETVGGRNFIANGPYHQCLRLCANTTVQVCLGPLAADEYPVVNILPGCLGNGCDVECPPAQFIYTPTAWVYNAASGEWCNVIVVATDGCACLEIEFIFGVVDVQLAVQAGDGAVNVNWSTQAESDMSRYDVRRRVVGHEFTTIGSVTANNTNVASEYTFVDEDASNGTMYEYTLQLVDVSGNVTELGVIQSATPSVDAAVVTEYALYQNYPNPFNPSTNLVFDVLAENNVNLTVYNAMGQEVATLVNGTMGAGRHTVSFDAANLTSGLYFYTVKIGNEFTATKKMLLVK